MKKLDEIAYENAIRVQEMNLELCDYKLTEAFDDLFRMSRNWTLKWFLLQDNAKDIFTRVRDTFILKRDSGEAYPYDGVSPLRYVFMQRVSIVLTAVMLKRARKEMAELK